MTNEDFVDLERPAILRVFPFPEQQKVVVLMEANSLWTKDKNHNKTGGVKHDQK